MQDIFDDHCKRHNILRDVPMLHFIDQFRQIYYPTQVSRRHGRRKVLEN